MSKHPARPAAPPALVFEDPYAFMDALNVTNDGESAKDPEETYSFPALRATKDYGFVITAPPATPPPPPPHPTNKALWGSVMHADKLIPDANYAAEWAAYHALLAMRNDNRRPLHACPLEGPAREAAANWLVELQAYQVPAGEQLEFLEEDEEEEEEEEELEDLEEEEPEDLVAASPAAVAEDDYVDLLSGGSNDAVAVNESEGGKEGPYEHTAVEQSRSVDEDAAKQQANRKITGKHYLLCTPKKAEAKYEEEHLEDDTEQSEAENVDAAKQPLKKKIARKHYLLCKPRKAKAKYQEEELEDQTAQSDSEDEDLKDDTEQSETDDDVEANKSQRPIVKKVTRKRYLMCTSKKAKAKYQEEDMEDEAEASETEDEDEEEAASGAEEFEDGGQSEGEDEGDNSYVDYVPSKNTKVERVYESDEQYLEDETEGEDEDEDEVDENHDRDMSCVGSKNRLSSKAHRVEEEHDLEDETEQSEADDVEEVEQNDQDGDETEQSETDDMEEADNQNCQQTSKTKLASQETEQDLEDETEQSESDDVEEAAIDAEDVESQDESESPEDDVETSRDFSSVVLQNHLKQSGSEIDGEAYESEDPNKHNPSAVASENTKAPKVSHEEEDEAEMPEAEDQGEIDQRNGEDDMDCEDESEQSEFEHQGEDGDSETPCFKSIDSHTSKASEAAAEDQMGLEEEDSSDTETPDQPKHSTSDTEYEADTSYIASNIDCAPKAKSADTGDEMHLEDESDYDADHSDNCGSDMSYDSVTDSDYESDWDNERIPIVHTKPQSKTPACEDGHVDVKVSDEEDDSDDVEIDPVAGNVHADTGNLSHSSAEDEGVEMSDEGSEGGDAPISAVGQTGSGSDKRVDGHVVAGKKQNKRARDRYFDDWEEYEQESKKVKVMSQTEAESNQASSLGSSESSDEYMDESLDESPTDSSD